MPIIPDIPTQTGSNFQPVAPSVSAAMAPGRALQSVGGGIQDAASNVSAIAQRRQAETDLAAKNRLRLAMQKAADEHQLFREENPDESTWEKDIDERLSRVKEAAAKENTSRQARQELDMMVDGWDSQYRNGTKTDAIQHRRAINRTEQTQLVEAYRRANRFDDARTVMQEGVSAGLFDKVEFEADMVDLESHEKSVQEREIATKYELGAEDDPVSAIEVLSAKGKDGYLNEPGMDEGTRHDLIRNAKRVLARYQESEFDTFKAAIDRGETTPAEIESLPLYLSESDKKNLMAYRKRFEPPSEAEDREAWGIIQELRDGYNAAKEGNMDEVEYRTSHRNARTGILKLIPKGYSGPLLETLQRYSPARLYDPSKPETEDDIRKDAQVEARAALRAYEASGVWGQVGRDRTPLENEKAARQRRDAERKALQWISKQKDITPEAARDYVDTMVSGKVSASGAKVLGTSLPGAGLRMRPLPGMEPGTGTSSDALLPKLESRLNSAIE